MNKQKTTQEKSIHDVFHELIKENTLIKMRIPKLGYEQLTMVTDIRMQKKDAFFIIDPPSGFYDIVNDIDHTRIYFDFNTKDGIQYAFKSVGGLIRDEQIWIEFPDIIERIQRRKDFRLEFPKGSVMRFQIESIEYEMNLINLSMGGAYAEISLNTNGAEKSPRLKSGSSLHNVVLSAPSEEGNLDVHILKISIIRVERAKTEKGCKLGLQFTDMDSGEVKILKKIIYDFQRRFLQKRLKPDV